MENPIIGLTPPSTPFLAKIMENFEKYWLSYGLKKWSSIEKKFFDEGFPKSDWAIYVDC